MNHFDKSVSATRMISEGFCDLFEEDRLQAEADQKAERTRRLIVQGFYPHDPKVRMSLEVHRDQLEAIKATADEWRVFQERNDLANGRDPATGELLTREQHAEVVRYLDLTAEDLRAINYWASAERDMIDDAVAEDIETAWRIRAAE